MQDVWRWAGQGLLLVSQLSKLKLETSLVLFSHKYFQNLIVCFRSWTVNPAMCINDDRLLLDLRKTIYIFCVSYYVSQLAVWDEVFWRCSCLSSLAFSFNADKLCYLQDGKEGLERKLQSILCINKGFQFSKPSICHVAPTRRATQQQCA